MATQADGNLAMLSIIGWGGYIVGGLLWLYGYLVTGTKALVDCCETPFRAVIPAASPLLMLALGFFGFMVWRSQKAAGAQNLKRVTKKA